MAGKGQGTRWARRDVIISATSGSVTLMPVTSNMVSSTPAMSGGAESTGGWLTATTSMFTLVCPMSTHEVLPYYHKRDGITQVR
jgi:hypothetical protein